MTAAKQAPVRESAEAIFQAAIAVVNPRRLVRNVLDSRSGSVIVLAPDGREHQCVPPVLVVGAGKAAAGMAAGCEDIFGTKVFGEVVVADGTTADLHSISVTEAGHPLPDQRGLLATHRILDLVRHSPHATLLCLISGGASSLLVQPRPPITLAEKVHTTGLLLQCGAEITEFNTVRKHLSVVKGGGLLQHAARPVVGLLISDVIGDDPTTIGSGPTVPDPTTFDDAWAILERYGLLQRVPRSVASVLQRGMAGEIAETLKPAGLRTHWGTNLVLGSNRLALEGAADQARRHGWTVVLESNPLLGDTTAAAKAFGGRLRDLANRQSPEQPTCVLAGGETTVRVVNDGRGGRNQEFALALAAEIAGTTITLLSAGTDGIDGPTDAAGAYVDGTTIQRARHAGLDPQRALAANDSYPFFLQLGDLLRCGPTGTNVMDIKIALLPSKESLPGRSTPGVLGTRE